MSAPRAALLTPSSNSNRPLWSYHHTGTLPLFISFVSHSSENTGGIGVFFPFWNSLVVCRGFDPGNEPLSKSHTACMQRITACRPLAFHSSPGRVWEPFGVHCHSCLKSFSCNTHGHPPPQLLQTKDLPRSTVRLTPLDATPTKSRGRGYKCFRVIGLPRPCRGHCHASQHWCYHSEES